MTDNVTHVTKAIAGTPARAYQIGSMQKWTQNFNKVFF